MRIFTMGVLAAALLLGAIPARAGSFNVQTEASIFLNEVAGIPQMHDPDKFRRVVQMRFDMFTLAYTTSTPIFSGGKSYDVSARLTGAEYGKAAQVVESVMRERPRSINPAIGVLQSIVETCIATSSRCSD